MQPVQSQSKRKLHLTNNEDEKISESAPGSPTSVKELSTDDRAKKQRLEPTKAPALPRSMTSDMCSDGCSETLDAILGLAGPTEGHQCVCVTVCVAFACCLSLRGVVYPESVPVLLAGQAELGPGASAPEVKTVVAQMDSKGRDDTDLPRPKESKYGPIPKIQTKNLRRRERPKQFKVTADVPDSPIALSYNYNDDDAEEASLWGDIQPDDDEIPRWPDEAPLPSDDDGTFPVVEDDALERQVLQQSAKASRISNYTWSQSTRDFAEIPDSFQDAVPMKKRQRKELLKGCTRLRGYLPVQGYQ